MKSVGCMRAYDEERLGAGGVALQVGLEVAFAGDVRWVWPARREGVGVPGLHENERMPLSAYRLAASRATRALPCVASKFS